MLSQGAGDAAISGVGPYQPPAVQPEFDDPLLKYPAKLEMGENGDNAHVSGPIFCPKYWLIASTRIRSNSTVVRSGTNTWKELEKIAIASAAHRWSNR